MLATEQDHVDDEPRERENLERLCRLNPFQPCLSDLIATLERRLLRLLTDKAKLSLNNAEY